MVPSPDVAGEHRLAAHEMKTLAHPLRSRLLTTLRMHGPATATELARELGTNSGATSYHLRRLAEAGLIDDDPDAATPDDPETGEPIRTNRRERRWRARAPQHRWRGSDYGDDHDAASSAAWLERDYLHHFYDRAQRWLDLRHTWPAQWSDELGLSDHLALVDLGQLRRLQVELEAVLAKYARVGQGNPGARRIAIYTHLYPIDVERPPTLRPGRDAHPAGPA